MRRVFFRVIDPVSGYDPFSFIKVISTSIQISRKLIYQFLLCISIEIDHHIPAENNVKRVTELERIHQIKSSERN